jgi:4-hydroxybutyrate dehydrogenase
MANIPYLTDTRFDHGVRGQLASALKRLGVTRPLVVSDAGIKAAGVLDQALEALTQPPALIFTDTPPNPTEASVRAGVSAYQSSGADGLIAVGGGSAMDLAKIIGLMATHEGNLAQYGTAQRGTRLIRAIPPLVALPTTSGTGSEVSLGAMIVMDTGEKELFVSNHLIPKVALCDPELTLGLPAGLTAATGMDAVVHCIESLLSPTINPPADAIAVDGVQRALGQGWLARAVADGANRDARWHMMMTSVEGALAFGKGLGSVHALSHAAGALPGLGLHHGLLNAIFLPHVMRVNVGVADEKMMRLRSAMGLAERADLGDALTRINQELGIAPDLKCIGVTHAHGDFVVRYALSDLAHLTNCKPLSQSDYEALFLAALG